MANNYDNEDIIEQNEALENEVHEVATSDSGTEIRRIYTGATTQESTTDQAVEKPEKKRGVWGFTAWFVRGILTGTILLHSDAKRIYNLFILLGAIFLASILTIFSHLQKDLQWSKLHREVEFLRDRATRTAEIRAERTSHSAILRQLKERNINIDDPKTTPSSLK